MEVFKLKKLIETSLPLEVINKESAREKSIRHGHPSTLHLYWARRPLATARVVLFASLIDDPSENPEKFPTPELQEAERKRLFAIIERLVKWENSNNDEVFKEALKEIKNCVGENLPAVFDPFAGGGTIPLEAQRLGLKSFAADLNPVAIMINKAMIEIPAKFKNLPPVNPNADKNIFGGYHGAEGLAEDILYYGKILKQRAFEKIGNLYPKIDGKTVIAWLWARTVTCSNPACLCQMPLVHSFKLSTKQNISVKPVVHGKDISFQICQNDKNIPDGTVNRNGARCLCCGANVPLDHVRQQAKDGKMSAKLLAIVAEGANGRIYLPPNVEHEKIADIDKPDDFPEQEMNEKCPDLISGRGYGFKYWHQLFTNRQLTALTTFSDLISEIQRQVQDYGGSKDYSNAVAVYLSFLVDKLAMFGNSFCHWDATRDGMAQIFIRQAVPMQWDFAEANFFSNSTGCFDNMLDWLYKAVKNLPAKQIGEVKRHNALEKFSLPESVIVSTDPPYYDNIGYADLAEFFYVWLRRPLKNIYPEILGRMTFDKSAELIASQYRHGNKAAAKEFFESGMFDALKNIYEIARADFPITIYYAFKQQESDSASSGWETMLTSIIRAGFQITATLPMRTELTTALKNSVNALASSIVLACRKRPAENKFCGKNKFLAELKTELKAALEKWQQANIAPVDMAQAAIGPGISVYSRYEKIADMSDNPVTVRDALKIINAELDEHLNGQSKHLDAASQFCVDLFTQKFFNEMKFGDADTLARAKNISVAKVEEIGAVLSLRGNVRLRDRDELEIYDDAGNLAKNFVDKLIKNNCAWLWVQSLVEVFGEDGLSGAAELLAKFEGDTDSLKNLAYRLYDICEKRYAKEATCYNELVVEWQDILGRTLEFRRKPAESQTELF